MSKREPEAESDASDDETEVQEIDLKNVDELAPEIANLFIKKAPVVAAEKQEESDAEEAPDKAAADYDLTEDQKFIAADAEAEPKSDDEAESADEADDEKDAEEDEAEEEEEKPVDYSLGFGTFGGMGYDPTGYFESKGGEAP